MKFSYKYLFIFILLFSFTILNTKALTYNEITNRTLCSNYELAEAKKDKTLSKIECYNDYQSAKNAMNNNANENLVILERSNNITRVIDAKLALVYLDFGEVVTDYYSNSNLSGYITYMNHSANYGATDGVFLEFNNKNHAIKVKTNGIVGWIKDGRYKIIPLNFIGTTSYYQITNDSLIHYYGKNIETTYSSYGRTIDKKPDNINNGKYYSYDGNYFYTDLSNMIKDYKNNNYNNSINKNNPYYNYYMYLPHRARSNYTANDIDAYLKNTRNLIGTIYGKNLVSRYSNMWATGIYFKSSETLYGGNAILMMSLAINESALGQSLIAIDKNNLFGHAAYDSSAYDSATGYLDPYQSILGHAKGYINCGYANPKDYRYYGSNMGNKSSGMNIMYASDPYWGEKAANYYYSFDKDNGFLDYNYYSLGITTHDSVNVRTEPNLTSSIPYNLKYQNVPLIILGEVNGTSVNGTTKWYKIVSDANLTTDRKNIQSCSFTNYYNYNSYVYIHSSFVKRINSNNKYNQINIINDQNIEYQEYSSGAVYTPKVGKIVKDTIVYDTATLSVPYGKTIKKDNMTPIFMKASIDGKDVAYLVEVDYSKNQKGWINANDLTIVEKDLLKVNINERAKYINVYKNVNGSVLGSMYDSTYSIVLDKKIDNNNTWLKIYYGVDNTIGWVNTNISESIGKMSYTTNYLGNQYPTITANDITLLLNQEYNPLNNVKAEDLEDGNLTNKIKIIKNTVNIEKIGTYEITYQVTDSKNQITEKTIKVIVNDFKKGNPLFMFESLKQINNTIFEFKGFLGIKKMNNKNIVHYLEFINEDNDIKYTFKLDKYTNYPYEMSSLDDDKKYDYSGGWFKGKINLNKNNISEGNYNIIIKSYNYDTGYYTEDYFTNIAYIDMPRRIKTEERGISFDIDYSSKGSPMLVSIRNKGLISYTEPTSFDPTYNFFNTISLNNNILSIMGTSHSININYSKNDDIKRELIFENKDNYEKISYDIGYIDNGLYKIELPVSDKKDKTRAWFNSDIDLSKLNKGTYIIYIKTTSNNSTYYGELIDIAYTDFSKINTNKYILERNDNNRLRLELKVL